MRNYIHERLDFQSITFNKMDVICVKLKFSESHGELSYIYNGTKLGKAYTEIDCSKRWSVMVKLFRPTQKIELMELIQNSTDKSIRKIIRYSSC